MLTLRFGRIVACLALGSACADSETPESNARKLCPDCVSADPSDNSAVSASTIASCARAYLVRTIDAAEAERKGFPVRDTAAQIERPLDTPIAWVPQSTTGGGPASGYERETRIRGAFKVESYEYHSLDPARCDGTRCTIPGEPDAEQAPCPQHYILMHVSGQLETLDGAIIAPFPKQVTSMRRAGQTDDIVIGAVADLSKARGSMVLDPTIPPPRAGKLSLSIQFADNQRRGYGLLSVVIVPDRNNSDGIGVPDTSANYMPLQAQWGEPPTGRPTVTSP